MIFSAVLMTKEGGFEAFHNIMRKKDSISISLIKPSILSSSRTVQYFL